MSFCVISVHDMSCVRMIFYISDRIRYDRAIKEGSTMEDHPRVRKKPADVKVHIRRMNNVIILSGIPSEHKENAGKICEETRSVIS